MRALAGAILAALTIGACGSPQANSSASPSPKLSPSATASPSTDPSLACTSKPVPGHPLVLLEATLGTATGLAVVDVVDPLHPLQVCGLSNAAIGRFISPTKITFWQSTFIGVADLAASSVTWSRAFIDAPAALVFSPDGKKWAYQTGDETTGTTTHLVIAGKDETILTRAPLGGHGGPAYGPLDQLEFSAHGDYLLTYTAFAAAGGPPNFMVFAMDGSVAFRSARARFGAWDRAGNRLYFLAATSAASISGQVQSWDPGGLPVVRSRTLGSYFWPTVSPDGRLVLFNSYNAKGLPHLWRLDIATRGLVQLSTAGSSGPVFVGPGLVWSNDEKPCVCGPGGSSAPDGKVLAHDMQIGADRLVGDFTGFTLSRAPTRDILDVWLG